MTTFTLPQAPQGRPLSDVIDLTAERQRRRPDDDFNDRISSVLASAERVLSELEQSTASDISRLSFNECTMALRALLCVPFSAWLCQDGRGYGDVLHGALQPLISLVVERLQTLDTKRAERAIESAFRLGERRRVNSPPLRRSAHA